MAKLRMLKPRVATLKPQRIGKPATKRTYGNTWMKIRRRVLRDEPTCRMCEATGMLPIRPSVEVDHIVPLIDGGTDERSNLQGICHPHHEAKSEVERVRRLGGQ